MLEESRRRVVTDAGSGASTRRKLRFVAFCAHSVDNTILTFEHFITTTVLTPIIRLFCRLHFEQAHHIGKTGFHLFIDLFDRKTCNLHIDGISGASIIV